MNRFFFVGAFNQANLNVSSTRTMAGWAIGGEFKRHVERISDWILLASRDTRPYDTHNGRWTKQQSIKTKLGSVRRIPSIKLGTSKYLARRRKRTRKGEKVDRRGEFCAGWRSTFLEGWLPGISLYLQNPNPRDKELPPPSLRLLFLPTLGSLRHLPSVRDSLRFLIPARLRNRLWAWSLRGSRSNNLSPKF